jgi:hypothetical protein
MALSGDTTVDELAVSMAELATNTSKAIEGLGTFTNTVLKPFQQIATVLEKFILATDPFMDLIIEGDPSGFMNRPRARARRFFEGGQDSVQEATRLRERAKAEAAAAKRAKELAALQKKGLDTQKKSLALQRASKTLDLEGIGIAAALKGDISKTDRLSLELQKALLDGNTTLATQLSDQLEAAIKRNNELRLALLSTPKAPNPFSEWSIPKLDFGGNLLGSPVPNFVPPSYAAPPGFFGPQGGLPAGVVAGVNPEPVVNVTVVLDDGVVAGAVSQVQTNNNLSGSFTTVGGRGANTARFT